MKYKSVYLRLNCSQIKLDLENVIRQFPRFEYLLGSCISQFRQNTITIDDKIESLHKSYKGALIKLAFVSEMHPPSKEHVLYQKYMP